MIWIRKATLNGKYSARWYWWKTNFGRLSMERENPCQHRNQHWCTEIVHQTNGIYHCCTWGFCRGLKNLSDQFQKKCFANKLELRRNCKRVNQFKSTYIKAISEIFEALALIGDPESIQHASYGFGSKWNTKIENVIECLQHEERKRREKRARSIWKRMKKFCFSCKVPKEASKNSQPLKCHYCGTSLVHRTACWFFSFIGTEETYWRNGGKTRLTKLQ